MDVLSSIKYFLGYQSLPKQGLIIEVHDGYYLVELRENLFCRVEKAISRGDLEVGDVVETHLAQPLETKHSVILSLARIAVFWFFVSLFFMLLYAWYFQG